MLGNKTAIIILGGIMGIGLIPVVPVGNGVISAAHFVNQKGETADVQIPDTQYKAMQGVGGEKSNPKLKGYTFVNAYQYLLADEPVYSATSTTPRKNFYDVDSLETVLEAIL